MQQNFKGVLAEMVKQSVEDFRFNKSWYCFIYTETMDAGPVITSATNTDLSAVTAVTNDTGFLTSQDDIVMPNIYKASDRLLVDNPHYGRMDSIHAIYACWDEEGLKLSECHLNLSLPGVSVVTLDALKATNLMLVQCQLHSRRWHLS